MTSPSVRKPGRFSLKNDHVQAFLMLLPMLLGFALFTYGPILYILRFCLYKANDFKATYIGFDNFVRLFTRDSAFWDAILNTLILSFGKLVIEIPLAMLLAVLLNRGIRGTGFYRTMLFLPAITSTAIVGLVFSLMFASFDGIVNNILQSLNLISRPINWMGNKWTALEMLGIASIWNNFPINMIYFLMALQSVPKEIYECAELDGVTPWKRFWRITLPMIAPIAQVVILMAIVGSLKVSDLVLASTTGAPGGKTEVIMTYVFKYFFGYSGRSVEIGYASAMSVVTGIFLAFISMIYMRVTNKMNQVY